MSYRCGAVLGGCHGDADVRLPTLRVRWRGPHVGISQPCNSSSVPLELDPQEALSALSKPVVKAVFFLEPEPGGDRPRAEALSPPTSEALPLVTYELCSTPSSSAAAWYSDLVNLICDRSVREHEESGQSVPEDPTTTFVRESVLQSLMRSATCAFRNAGALLRGSELAAKPTERHGLWQHPP
jgi:hypothetical protein